MVNLYWITGQGRVTTVTRRTTTFNTLTRETHTKNRARDTNLIRGAEGIREN